MQQVALDASQNPVILVRLVKLPAGSDAEALAIFNTPLGTLLPTGLGFRVDSAQPATLPFEWCVQEGCIVRLGLRAPEVAAMKRGRAVTLTVTSIAEANQPVELTLSLTGFTAAYDSLTAPAAPPAPAQPAAPAAPAQE
jgi:invasion protein IalB